MKEKLSLKVLLLILLVVIPLVKINGESITQQQLNAISYMSDINSTLNNQIFTLDSHDVEITIPPGESLTFFLETFSFPESAAMDNVTVYAQLRGHERIGKDKISFQFGELTPDGFVEWGTKKVHNNIYHTQIFGKEFDITSYCESLGNLNKMLIRIVNGHTRETRSITLHSLNALVQYTEEIPNQPPHVEAYGTELQGDSPLIVQFTAQGSDPEEDSLNYFWDFGDNTISYEQNPEHIYEHNGIYNAKVTVNDDNGGISYDNVIVTVGTPVFDGYGHEATGGQGYTVFTAHNPLEFENILAQVIEQGGYASIKLEGEWNYTSDIVLNHLSSVTLNGLNSRVTFENMTLSIRCSFNIVLRGLRLRGSPVDKDALVINSSERVVVTHSSMSHAQDGAVDIVGWSCGPSTDITISWSIMAHTWKQSLVRYNGTTNISFHHNLYYNSGTRIPGLFGGTHDIRNNVFYQWGSSGTSLGEAAEANIINNYYVVGQQGDNPHAAIMYRDDSSAAWIAGNFLPAEEMDTSRLLAPLSAPEVFTESALAARESVIRNAGAMPRDSLDRESIFNLENNFSVPLPPVVD